MRRDSEAAWRRFHEQVDAQGGRVIELHWLGAHERHRVICRAGHETTADPSSVNRGTGICRPCSGTDTTVAEKAFRALIAERGWTLIEPVWLGSKKPHRVICAEGHETRPIPSSLVGRGTACIVCTGKDQGTAWRLFCRLVEECGGTVLEPKPLGVNKPHRVLCPQGHETAATPTYVRIGGGICNLCAPTSTVRAEQQFRDLIADLGGTVTEPTWLGGRKPHRVVCSQGHETTPRPSDIKRTRSICRVCAGHDSGTSWQEFQALVAKQGGTVLELAWLGNKKPHRVACKDGHESAVRPNNVQQGSGICRICAYKVWDVFYVVANDTAHTVKFGITSHDARARLRTHRVAGYERVIKTINGISGAQALERAVISALASAGIAPVRGREYYDLDVLAVVLGVVNKWRSAAT